jgi:hypothetical protein
MLRKVELFTARPTPGIKERMLHRYRTRAASVWTLTAAGFRCGFRSANPARRIQYAARIPKTIEPIDAETSITKLKKSAIDLAPGSAPIAFKPLRCASNTQHHHTSFDAEFAEKAVALTLVSIDN